MRRHSKTGDARAKARLTTRARKQTKAPKGGRRTPLPGQKTEIARLSHELLEAHEQQRATSEILDVIARSRTDIQSVLDNVCQSATQLCEAYDAAIWQPEGERLLLVAHHGPITQTKSVPLVRGSVLGSSILDKRTVHIADLQSGTDEFPVTSALARRLGFRTGLYVPLIRESVAIGVIALRRAETQHFTERQVALLQTFANQAVIAIENARLLKELRERTDQLEARSKDILELNRQLERRVADQVSEIERMGRLRRFLPPQVADLIVASGSEKLLESHRREITALFCDLRGFTGFSESSDPEDVMALLQLYHAAIGQIIIKYSGTLERYAGDGVMVVFNDPVPVPNPALQAVRMALDMRSAIGALIEKWRRLGHDLGFGIGISHGFATLGTIGFEGRFDYAAIGTVSNVASRLCDEAKPGQILISPRVLMAVEEAVTVEPVGEFALKGIRRPMTAYNVLAVAPTKSLN